MPEVPEATAREVRMMVWGALLNEGRSPEFIASLILPEQRARLLREFAEEG